MHSTCSISPPTIDANGLVGSKPINASGSRVRSGGADPVGQIVRLSSSPFLVVGVMQRKVQESSYSGRDKDKVFIPASTTKSSRSGMHC